VPGGTFLMGTDDPDGFVADGEGPVREVHVSSFLIDATAVSNRRFAAFVEDTGYVTDAERAGWSFVFYAMLDPHQRRAARRGVVGSVRPAAPSTLVTSASPASMCPLMRSCSAARRCSSSASAPVAVDAAA